MQPSSVYPACSTPNPPAIAASRTPLGDIWGTSWLWCEAAKAQRLGWRTAHVEADHLAIMTHAQTVAERIAALADELQLAATSPTE